jgi:hypothetical protein
MIFKREVGKEIRGYVEHNSKKVYENTPAVGKDIKDYTERQLKKLKDNPLVYVYKK